jgi:Copper type II ascorbate-dependent monooxygenase, C-terminal domain
MRNILGVTAILVTICGCGSEPEAPSTAPAQSAQPMPPSMTPAATPNTTTPNSPKPASGAAGAAAPAITPPTSNPAAGTPAPAKPMTAAGSGAMMMPSAPTPEAATDWKPLLQGAWELPAGEEGYRCVRLTATEDMYIKEFQPIAPLGTHHTLLSVNEMPKGPDGVSNCTAGDNGHTTLLGSGVGESYSAGPLPEGVAYKVAKGSQLNLNLHLFNVSDAALKGVSGTKVRTTTADKVKQFAETILAGPVSLSIPVGKSTTMGKCTVKSDTTVFAVSPHMHQLGVHLKAVATRAGGMPTVMLYDGPYDFYEQRQFPAAVALKMGDTIQVECTYQNDTQRTVSFGESSLDEMCFIGVYRYPVAGEGLICLR